MYRQIPHTIKSQLKTIKIKITIAIIYYLETFLNHNNFSNFF